MLINPLEKLVGVQLIHLSRFGMPYRRVDVANIGIAGIGPNRFRKIFQQTVTTTQFVGIDREAREFQGDQSADHQPAVRTPPMKLGIGQEGQPAWETLVPV